MESVERRALRQQRREAERRRAYEKRCHLWANRFYKRIRTRSRELQWPCDVTRAWIAERLLVGRCELSGLPFVFHPKQPFLPSIDRIDSRQPYTQANCRVILLLLNYAKNRYKEQVFVPALLAAAEGVLRHQQPTTAP